MGSKMKRTNKLIIFAFVCLIPIVFAAIPLSNAAYGTIDADTHIFDSGTGYKRVRADWSVESVPSIDVFILTTAQYTTWVATPNVDRTAYVWRALSTSSGSHTHTIDEASSYFVVFSNENGGVGAYGDYEMTWWLGTDIPAFELLGVLFGILFIGMCFYLGRRLKVQRI